ERNLAYVAITRAKTNLVVSYADSRMVYGRIQDGGASPFLKEALTEAA
ncbi:3'-5' exonuclease, partial [Acinetobacter baumannii]